VSKNAQILSVQRGDAVLLVRNSFIGIDWSRSFLPVGYKCFFFLLLLGRCDVLIDSLLEPDIAERQAVWLALCSSSRELLQSYIRNLMTVRLTSLQIKSVVSNAYLQVLASPVARKERDAPCKVCEQLK
jgi:hypothetical protein